MNRKIIINLALLMAMALPSWAISIPDSLNYTFRIGYNIGGTAPIGMPVTIRSLNSYDFQPNITLGLDVQKDIWGPWGLLAGVHIENKGMKIDATVKNYHMEMVQGGEHLEGMYTGNLVTECNRWMLTIPVMATLRTGRFLIKCGPYVSYVATNNFEGHVYDGYLRTGDPTGESQWGVNLGADFLIGKRIGVSADLAWGLNGAFKSSFHTIEQTLYPIYGTIGLIYKLR